MKTRFEKVIEDLEKKLVDPTTIAFLKYKERELLSFYRAKERFSSAKEIIDNPNKYHHLFKDDEWKDGVASLLAEEANTENIGEILIASQRFVDNGLEVIKKIILKDFKNRNLMNHPAITHWFKLNYNQILQRSQCDKEFENDFREYLGMKPIKSSLAE